jgi:pimeloyl-ACP methyl ester carboxylesterase
MGIDVARRRFLGTAAMTIAAAQFGIFRAADAQSSFGTLKQIDAGVLNIGYAEAGPVDGRVVILLHGWPYAQQSAVALDIIALMDALRIDKAILGGFDWGARTVDVIAALWPERCKAIVAVSGYLVTNLKANLQPLPPAAELGWWYQYYFATERGRLGYSKNRHEFNKLIWNIASPKWDFDDATYERTAASFNNSDHVSIVIHNYRWRLNLAKGEARYELLEQRLSRAPVITVPAITIASDFDGPAAVFAPCSEGHRSQRASRSSGGVCEGNRRSRRLLRGIHRVQATKSSTKGTEHAWPTTDRTS